jgi:hypothetical protein
MEASGGEGLCQDLHIRARAVGIVDKPRSLERVEFYDDTGRISTGGRPRRGYFPTKWSTSLLFSWQMYSMRSPFNMNGWVVKLQILV